MLAKPSNERSLWGTAEDKRPRRKNSHVSTSITPNPCLVHPLLWQGEGTAEREESGDDGGGRQKRERREKQRKDKSQEKKGGKKIKTRKEMRDKRGKLPKDSSKVSKLGYAVCEIESEDGFKKRRARQPLPTRTYFCHLKPGQEKIRADPSDARSVKAALWFFLPDNKRFRDFFFSFFFTVH